MTGSLSADERVDHIAAAIQHDGRVRIVELTARFDVSEMTIRRDLDLLEARGVLRRVRGGAVAVGPRPFAERYGRQAAAKTAVANKLLPLVGDGGAIGLDASSTMQRLAAMLGEARDLTVVTNGPETFAALQNAPGATALLTGGQLDSRTGSLIGPLATRAAQDLVLRRYFVSAAALDPVHGSSEHALEEADVKLALGAAATEIVLAVDSSKLTAVGTARCFALDRISTLVTDLDPSHPDLDPYRDRVDLL